MTFNLRLPPDLDLMARAKSEGLGISLNALICVALGEYLKTPIEAPRVSRRPPMVVRRPVQVVAKVRPPESFKSSPVPVQTSLDRVLSPPGPHASKAERRAYTAQIRLSRKS